MFSSLGKLVVRFWPVVLAVWAVGLALCLLYAPPWDTVEDLSEVASLPAEVPSRQADELLKQAFPKTYAGSGIVIVAWRDGAPLEPADRHFISFVLAPGVRSLPETKAKANGRPVVTQFRSLANEGMGALLVSSDKEATLVVMDLDLPFLDRRSLPLVQAVENLVGGLEGQGRVPEGLHLALTGSATAGRDLHQAERQSVHAVELWTVIVVVVLLLVLYRAPLVALIPLVTVFFAVQIALRLLALLAALGVLGLYRDISVFITVLIYGAGVDYCVFLLARYREELDAGIAARTAVADAVSHVGLAITASAATVICGIAMLAFARFSKIHEAGTAIPLALCLVLAAALTLTAALLCLAGHWAFWPQRNALSGVLARHWLPSVWEKLGPVLVRRPGIIQLVTLLLMVPFVVIALWLYNEQNYNPLSELPAAAPSSIGTRAVTQHFPPGLLGQVTVLLHNDGVDFGSQEGIDLVTQLTERLEQDKDALGIVDVRSVAKPLGITPAAERALTDVPVSGEDLQTQVRLKAVAYYVSHAGSLAGHVTHLDLVLNTDPLSRPALDELARIEAALPQDLPSGLAGSQLALSGATPSTRDLAAVKGQDERRIDFLVPALILVLLLIVLRRAVIALYLVLSVLFSYLATLGVTYLVFWMIHGNGFSGLDWKVPIFLFTILVAVGEDYNIFLVMRIREEQGPHGPVQGIPAALARTGRVISSCGFIMAGTFGCLLSGSLASMQELGFALAFGVLLDTLVVRPMLVPSFLLLLQNGTLGRLGRAVALVRKEHY